MSPKKLLTLLTGLWLAIASIAGLLALEQGSAVVPLATRIAIIASLAVIGIFVWTHRKQAWVRRWGILGTLGMITLWTALTLWSAGATWLAAEFAGNGLLVLGSIALLRGIRHLWHQPNPLSGYIGNTLDIIQHRGTLAPLIIVLVIIHSLCAHGSQSAGMRLDYQVQAYLSWSQLTASALLLVSLAVIAAANMPSEFHGKQIQTNLTKPISRWSFLAGKTIGTMLLAAILCMCHGGATWLHAHLIEWRTIDSEQIDPQDLRWQRDLLHRKVLCARTTLTPRDPLPDAASPYLLERINLLIAGSLQYGGDSNGEIGIPVELAEALRDALEQAKKDGKPAPIESILSQLPVNLRESITEISIGKWYSLGTLESNARTTEPSRTFIIYGDPTLATLAQRKDKRTLERLGRQLNLNPGQARDLLRAYSGWPVPLDEDLTELLEQSRTHKGIQHHLEQARITLEAHQIQLQLKIDAGGVLPRQPYAEVAIEIDGTPLAPINPRESQEQIQRGLSRSALLNGHRLVRQSTAETFAVAASSMDDKGRIKLRISRPLAQGTIPQPTLFPDSRDGIAIHFPKGGFAGNLLRAQIILWSKLSLIITLGIIMGSLLTFPVACATTALLMVIATSTSFLGESLAEYYPLGRQPEGFAGLFQDVFYASIRGIGKSSLWISPSFDRHDCQNHITDGQFIPWRMTLFALVHLVGLWSTCVWIIGGWLFNKREIAKVTV